MGKLIRNGIEYGGGNGTDIFEVTQAEYDALKQTGTLVHNALYVITDAPNLNPTASDIEYSSGVSVADSLDTLSHKETKTLNSGDMTFPTGYSLFANYPNNVIVRGNMAIVNISVKMNVSTAGSRYIDNFLPTGYRPTADVSGVVETGLGDGKMQPVYVKSNGQLGIPPVNLNTDTYAIGTVTIPL